MAENDFGWALAQMRAGHKVRRRNWIVEEWIEIKGNRLVNEDNTPCVFKDDAPLLALDWDIARG